MSNLDANLREEMRFEVRRLHDEYRYTTVYVTHDQSEAMTTADVIAVMNAGRIEQAGTPEEIYDRPRSEFVARFIGASNVIKGKAVDETHIACGEACCAAPARSCYRAPMAPFRCASTSSGCGPGSRTRWRTWLPGTVVRQVFLGNSRDYMVEAADGTQFRVITSPAENIAKGAPVWLYLPPERCRVLTRLKRRLWQQTRHSTGGEQ